MVRRPLRYVLAATFALTGCSALLDVKDIYFDPSAASGDGGPDGAPTEGGPSDGGADSQSCVTGTMTDEKNCGRCGHSCLGGACTAGVCQAVELASVTDAPMAHIAVSDLHVFASTSISLNTQVGGIWRIPKAGGAPELYSPIRYSQAMVIVADRLYFVVDDYVMDGTAGQTGGFYSCPVTGPAPCAPTLIAPAESPGAITVDKGRILYGDNRTGKGLMAYSPPAAPVVFRDGFGFSRSYFADGQVAYFVATFIPPGPPPAAKVFEILTDGGVDEKFVYDNAHAQGGRLVGNTNEIFFTAYDYQGNTPGAVRRIPRAAGAPCDIGGPMVRRPYGIYVDGTRVYWTNLGDGAAEPFTNGSLASCEQAGCCTTPKTMWTGDGQPEGITGDADAIYFVTRTKGSVWKVAKP